MTERNDMDLVRDYARRNSESAFAELVQRHINLVYSVALRYVGNSTDAQDVAQAVFIILAKKSASLRDKTVVTGWLYETTRFTAINFLRTKIRRESREQEAYMESTLNDSDTASVWQQIAPHLEDAMTRLSEKERTLLALHFFENKSGAETAATLGIEEWAARKRVTRAVEKLRKFFAKRGIGISAGVLIGAVTANSVQAAPAALATSISAVAITKGAAVGGSTLTLVKGALKIMAWTKMKMAMVTSVAVLLPTIAAVTIVQHYRHAPPAQSGRMNLPTGNVPPMIGFGYSHGVILASDGSLWTWGEEKLGWPVLGLKNIHNTTSLRRIGNEEWKDVAVGWGHNLAVKSDGTLWAWGQNLHYQLGDGTKTTRAAPVPSASGNDWKQAAVGGANSFGLKNDGTLWAWGNNWAGQLGIGSVKESRASVQIGSDKDWIKIRAGTVQTVGIKSNGSLWFWGTLTGSDKDTNKFLSPTRMSADTNWVDVCFGYFTVFALKSDGTLWSWGRMANEYAGQSQKGLSAVPVRIGTNNDWMACASADGFYQLLEKNDASIWALDASEYRTIKATYKPIQIRRVDLKKNIVAIGAGKDDVGIALTSDGEVWTWGSVLGENSPSDFSLQNGQMKTVKSKVINKPWQISNF